MHESIDSAVNADVIPGAAVRGFHAVAYINEVTLAQLWPGLDIGILRTSPGADILLWQQRPVESSSRILSF